MLSLTNVGLTDKTALLLADALEKNKTLRVLNVETNFINPPVIVKLVSSLLKVKTIEEFRASNQVRSRIRSLRTKFYINCDKCLTFKTKATMIEFEIIY